MKHFFTILLLAVTTFALGAEKIETTYAGITLGKTTINEIILNFPNCAQDSCKLNVPEILSSGMRSISYNGDFLVDGIHMHTLAADFVNDTLYKITFFDNSLNIDNKALYEEFLKSEKKKYASLVDLDTMNLFIDQPKEEHPWILRTDGTTEIRIWGRGDGIKYEVFDRHLDKLSWTQTTENLNKLISYNPDTDPKNKVTGVAGLRFGDTRVNIVDKIKGRWNRTNVDNKSLIYSDVTIGGTLYSFVILYFAHDNNNTQVLTSVNMQKSFHTWQYDEAVRQYENICSTYRNKYSNEHILATDKENKMACYGMISQDYYNGKLTPIIVTLTKSLSQGGDFYYYVQVNYFQANVENLYNDEI